MMRLTSLRLLRAPGLPREITLADLAPGLVLLVGPNASGKSTIGRVVQTLLWPDAAGRAGDGVQALTEWQADAGPASAQLAAGAVRWDPHAPRVPAAADAWRLSVAELLRTQGKADRRIADEIERALTGGYDISRAAKAFSASQRPPHALRRGLDAARGHSKAALAQADSLFAEEQELERLRAARGAALVAVGESVQAGKALVLARNRQQRLLQQAELAIFPDGLELLRGDELQRLRELQQDGQKVADERVQLALLLDEQDATIAELDWPGEAPDHQDLDAWRQRARDLANHERDLAVARDALTVAEAALTTARSHVLVDSRAPAEPAGAQAIESLERHVERRRELRAQVDAQQRVVDAIPAVAEGSDGAVLREGIQVLRAWLAVAGAPTAPIASPWIYALVVAGLIGALLGLWLGGPGWALPGVFLAGAGVGAYMALRAAVRADEGATERRIHRDRFLHLGLGPPAHWRIEAVQRHLASLEGQRDQAQEDGVWSARLQVERDRLARVSADLDVAQTDADEAARQLGVSADWSDLTLLQQTHRLNEAAWAAVARAEALASLATAEQSWRATRRGINQWLMSLQQADVGDAAAAIACIDAQTSRLTGLQHARATRTQLQRQIDSLVGRGDGLQQKTREFYQGCGLADGDQHALATRLAQLDGWRETLEHDRRLEREIAIGEADLAEQPAMLQLDEAGATQLIADCERRASGLEEASAAVAALEERLSSAALGTTLEAARLVEQNAELELATARDQAAEDAIGRALADWLRGQVSREHTPAVLERARALLLRFTRNAFDLQVDAEHGFVAMDVAAERQRRLAELSDGTRMQLLLAARLAFLEHAEGDGPKLPLFLDESLSTTDPHRFREAGRAVLDLIAQGRQVFYATADVAEARAWQRICADEGRSAPQVIDLGLARAEPPWPDDLPVAPTPLPAAPPVAGHDAASYAHALGLSPPVASDPVGAWHVIYLLHDDLDAVARLVAAGVDTVGHFLAFRDGRMVPLPLAEPSAARLAARSRLLEVVLELRAIGRNRPVSWQQVKASGAVTATFETPMRDLLATHGADAGRYLAAFEALKGSRKRSRLALREYLETEGLIASEPPLEVAEVVRRAAAAVGPLLRDEVLSLAEVAPLVDWLAALFGDSFGDGP